MIHDQSVIVLGLGPSGLFLVRQLHNITSEIYAVGRSDDVGLYSKYIDPQRRYQAITKEELVYALEDVRQKANDRPVLYISSDQYLTLLLESDVDWSEFAEIAGASFEKLALINDKQRIVRYCQKHLVHVPESYSLIDYENMPTKSFPVIVKLNEKLLIEKKNPVGKVRICTNQDEFDLLCKEFAESNADKTHFHVQTYIKGNNGFQYSTGGFYQDGVPLAEIVVNQVKQYPQGISAMVVTSEDHYAQRIRSISRIFAQNMSYSGFLEMEYKIDADTGAPYLLDVNPRPWGWVSALGAAYSDFYRVLCGDKPTEQANPVIWKSRLRTVLAIKNKSNDAVHLKRHEFKKAFDIYDPQDCKPSWMIYMMAVKKILRRLFR